MQSFWPISGEQINPGDFPSLSLELHAFASENVHAPKMKTAAATKVGNLEVIVDESTLYLSRNNLVGGRLYLLADGKCFPDERWFDFPIPVLTRWIEGVISLIDGQRDTVTLTFMDGPYRAIIKFVSFEFWDVLILEDCLSGYKQLAEIKFNSAKFLASMHCAANAVIDWSCRKNS